MRLQRLTGLQREELFKELIDALRDIARLQDILAERVEPAQRHQGASCKEIREQFGDERRTEITGEVAELTSEDLIAEEDDGGHAVATPAT